MAPRISTDDPRFEIEKWHLIWVNGLSIDPYRMTGLEYRKVVDWCNLNCQDLWTEHWYQDELAYCFRSRYDAVLFSMVWG